MKKYLLCALASAASLCADQTVFSVVSDGYVLYNGLEVTMGDTGTVIGTSRSGGTIFAKPFMSSICPDYRRVADKFSLFSNYN